jgi:hypothetical protein
LIRLAAVVHLGHVERLQVAAFDQPPRQIISRVGLDEAMLHAHVALGSERLGSALRLG